MLWREFHPHISRNFAVGNCSLGINVECELSDPKPAKCRLNIRMNAAFILAGALVIKAVYMVTTNILARGRVKRQLLTFGDVIVASALYPDLHVSGYVP